MLRRDVLGGSIAADKHMAQLQHNMWVTASRTAALSIITGGGKWVEMTIPADPLYQHLLLIAEKKFWRCVETGEAPAIVRRIEPPRPRVEAVQIASILRARPIPGRNSRACFAGRGEALISIMTRPRLN